MPARGVRSFPRRAFSRSAPPRRTASTPTPVVFARSPGERWSRTPRDGIHEKSRLAPSCGKMPRETGGTRGTDETKWKPNLSSSRLSRASRATMKGDAAMTQASIVLVFLMGFVGIMLWIIGIIALDILHDSQRTHDKRQKPAAPEQHDGYEPHHAHHGSQRL